jgi:phosphoribosylformylglycinamidine synthase
MGHGEQVPAPSKLAPRVYAALHSAIKQGLVRSAHDLSEGGLAVAAAEMCIGGRLGMELYLDSDDPLRSLFGETNGCLLVEIEPKKAMAFERMFENLPELRIANVIKQPTLSLLNQKQVLFSIPVVDLVSAWNPAH